TRRADCARLVPERRSRNPNGRKIFIRGTGVAESGVVSVRRRRLVVRTATLIAGTPSGPCAAAPSTATSTAAGGHHSAFRARQCRGSRRIRQRHQGELERV